MSQASINVSKALQDLARKIDREIEIIAGEPIAFTLLVFTDERASYISTCARDVSVREIKKLLEHWECGLPDIPAHDVN